MLFCKIIAEHYSNLGVSLQCTR